MGRAWASWYSNWNCKKRKYTHSANEPLHTHTQNISYLVITPLFTQNSES